MKPHVRHLGERHHPDVHDEHVSNQHQPVLGEDEVPPPPDDEVPALPQQHQDRQDPGHYHNEANARRGYPAHDACADQAEEDQAQRPDDRHRMHPDAEDDVLSLHQVFPDHPGGQGGFGNMDDSVVHKITVTRNIAAYDT